MSRGPSPVECLTYTSPTYRNTCTAGLLNIEKQLQHGTYIGHHPKLETKCRNKYRFFLSVCYIGDGNTKYKRVRSFSGHTHVAAEHLYGDSRRREDERATRKHTRHQKHSESTTEKLRRHNRNRKGETCESMVASASMIIRSSCC